MPESDLLRTSAAIRRAGKLNVESYFDSLLAAAPVSRNFAL